MSTWSRYAKDAVATGETSTVILNKFWAASGATIGVIYCHGATGTALESRDYANAVGIWRYLDALAEAGFPVIGCDLGGDGWGNDATLAKITAARAYLQGTVGAAAGKVILIGHSMGHLAAMAWTAAHRSEVAGVIGSLPVADLNDFVTNNRLNLAASVNAAYGGAYSEATYGASHNPLTMAKANAFAGLPYVAFYGNNDVVALTAKTEELLTAIGSTATGHPMPGGHDWDTVAAIPAAGVVAAVQSMLGAAPTRLAEADWLLGCVATDGAILETPGDVNVRPYMSHYGAIGLIRAYEVSGYQPYLDAGWAWLHWYAARMNPSTGYVNDFTGTPGNWTDSGAADSTDAYAGMYLTALWLAVSVDPTGPTRLTALAESVGLAVTAITSTQQADGLTWALPTYTVKYLEDNIETLVGLRAGYLLAQTLNDSALSARVSTAADAMSRGVGYLWNETSRTWDFAVHENGTFEHNNWADENSQRQQIWAAGWGAKTTGTLGRYDSVALTLTGYEAALPGWATQTSSSYEVMPAWVYQRLGRSRTTAVANLQAALDAHQHAYPWTVATSGQLILAKYGLGMEMLPGAQHPVADLDPRITFPTGANLLPNPTFVADTNNDGEADGLSNYGNPTMQLIPLATGTGNVQRMTVPSDNNWAINWDPIPVTPGHYYTFSVYRRINALQAGGQAVIKYELVDASGNVPAGAYGYDIASTVDTGAVRWSLTTFIPSGVVGLRCVIEVDHGGVIDLAYPKLEDAASPTDWATVPGFPASTAPTTAIFRDDFNREDGALTGPYRTTLGYLAGGKVKVTNPGEIHVFSSTQITSIAGDFVLPDAAPVALRLCAADSNHCYQANFDSSGACGIYTVVGGSVTQIAYTSSQIASSLPHLEFTRDGVTLTLRANGIVVTSVNFADASLDANTEAEVVLVSTAATFDNLVAVGMTLPTLTWGQVVFDGWTRLHVEFTLSGMGSRTAEVVFDSRTYDADPTPVYSLGAASVGDGFHSFDLTPPPGYPFMAAVFVDFPGSSMLGSWSRSAGQVLP